MKRIGLATALILTFFIVTICAGAQEVSPAPVPAQIASAKKVFIANGGYEGTYHAASMYSGGPNRAYNQFYAGIKVWGRFELASAPSDADLILEISQKERREPALETHLNLRIIDARTNVALWALTEFVEPAGMSKNREKNYDAAMAAVVNDLKNLVSPPTP